MDDEDTRVLMKYVRGEISFSDWLELGIPVADGSTLVDQDENAASSDTLYAPGTRTNKTAVQHCVPCC